LYFCLRLVEEREEVDMLSRLDLTRTTTVPTTTQEPPPLPLLFG